MGVIFPEEYYPNGQSTPQTEIYLEGDLVIICVQLHQITDEWKKLWQFFLLCYNDLLII